jgi:hypothetical protein
VTTPEAKERGCAEVSRAWPRVDEASGLIFVEARLSERALSDLPLGTAVSVEALDGRKCT